MEMHFKKAFSISVKVDPPVLIGNDDKTGRRQLVPVLEGEVTGEGIHGVVLPGGVDSQVIRPDGRAEISARYGIRFDDGSSVYIENNGIRTVPEEYVDIVRQGGFIDAELYYFCTCPQFECFGESVQWMRNRMFICGAVRLPDKVILDYFSIEKGPAE